MLDIEQFEIINDSLVAMIIEDMRENPFPKFLGLRFEIIRKGFSRMRMPYRRDFCNSRDIIHGGATASLIDTAVLGALRSDGLMNKYVTTDLKVSYLAAAQGHDLLADATVRRRGNNMVFISIDVFEDTTERIVAHGEATLMVVPKSKL
jgi:uncharacterized protein (TIGR00369 family)